MENNSNITEEEEVIYPSLVNRLQALFFDFWIIVAIVMFLFVNFFDIYEAQFTGLKIILFIAIVLVYDPIGSMTGGTIGYRTMGLKVRRGDGIRRISIVQAYKRSILKFALGWISFLTITSDRKSRAMHDKAADTLVMFSRG
jgi:uncharacterized RDD family membrane protein YckC